jgi:hypothetical protein
MHWMKHRWLLIMSMLLVVLASCSSPAASTPQPTATPTIDSAHLTAFAQPSPTYPPLPTPTPSQAPIPVPTPPRSALAPMPTNCPLTALPGTKVFPKGWGGYLHDETLVGRSPVWAGIGLELHLYTGDQGYHVVWNGTKILWEVSQDLTTTVTVRVKNLATGAPAWWGKGDQPPSEPVLVLDSRNEGYHGVPASGWYEWGSFLYLLTAGCYSMDVSWSGGSWHIVFAAGS